MRLLLSRRAHSYARVLRRSWFFCLLKAIASVLMEQHRDAIRAGNRRIVLRHRHEFRSGFPFTGDPGRS